MNSDRKRLWARVERRKFSSAFSRLVQHEKDIRGFVAYGLYKGYKASQIQHEDIKARDDTRLDAFEPNPEILEGFAQRADEFLEEINFKFSAKAIESTYSKQIEKISTRQNDQLDRIETSANSWNFFPGFLSSCSASICLGALTILLPVALWVYWPTFRQPLEQEALEYLTSSIEEPAEVLDALVEQLDEDQRQRYVEALITETVYDAIEPIYVLDAVVDTLDIRKTKDEMLLEHVRQVLKRAERPEEIASQVYQEEILRTLPAAQKRPSEIKPWPEPQENPIPEFDPPPLPKQRPAN